ncbi:MULTISPECIES: hypothetical protein [unclassified Psychrobacter]|uniref:hypothetical protein n=2 Tax=unclassified Psychrobacter TaxID=196806 RepID=UPI001868D340|nr:hypothetical protein [Psychrobacter sp. FME61]
MKGFDILRGAVLTSLASIFLLNTAQANNALKMTLTATKVMKDAEGQTSYIPIRTAPTGTIVQYKATYTNALDKDIRDMAVILPIPANMVFTGEAYPASALASIDSKNYGHIPLMRKINGKMIEIPLSEYRTLRWDIKLLPAKKSAAVAFNTMVD